MKFGVVVLEINELVLTAMVSVGLGQGWQK